MTLDKLVLPLYQVKQLNKTRYRAHIMNTIEKLTKFVNQRPGLEFANYGDSKAYNAESREITKDRADYFELIALAYSRIGNLDQELTEYLTETSGRLALKDGQIEYITGQYFCTEYRPAANRVIASLIWNNYRNEVKQGTNEEIYKDGHEIRKAISKRVSRRVMKNYFN